MGDIAQLQKNLPRLFNKTFKASLLGRKITPTIYLQNSFRFLSLPANSDNSAIDSNVQRFRNSYRVNPARALRSSIKVGYEAALPVDEPDRHISNVHDPRSRLINELFWFHLDGDFLQLVQNDRDLSSPKLVEKLEHIIGSNPEALQKTLARHALAIVCHNRAIAAEVQYIQAQTGEWPAQDWQNCLQNWSLVVNDNAFWNYIRERVAIYDGMELKPEDIARIRSRLPDLLYSFNAFFAREYAKNGLLDRCSKHLALLGNTDHGASHKTLIGDLATDIARTRLEPLMHKLQAEVLDQEKRISRTKFDEICNPLLEEAFLVRDFLIEEMKIPEDIADKAEYDNLCALVMNCLDNKIDYSSDGAGRTPQDVQRDILYSLLTAKRLQKLPSSKLMQNQIKRHMQNDLRSLYGNFADGSTPEIAFQCWFTDDEEADPDAAYFYDVYKITNREVQVDHSQMSAGIRVNYMHRRVLIPRCQHAAAEHRKTQKKPSGIVTKPVDRTAKSTAQVTAATVSLLLSIPGTIASTLLRDRALKHLPDAAASLPLLAPNWLGFIGSLFLWGNLLGAGYFALGFWLAVLGIVGLLFFNVKAKAAFDPLFLELDKSEAPVVKKVRPQSKGKDFPCYKKALAQGFKDGSEPNSYEMEMTASETAQARRMLGLF